MCILNTQYTFFVFSKLDYFVNKLDYFLNKLDSNYS